MKKRVNIWDLLWVVVPIGMICTASVLSNDLKCSEIIVKISDSELNQFLNEKRIVADVQDYLTYPLVDGKLIHNDISKMEKLLKSNKFVKSAEVLSDHKGRIVFEIEQERPIARIVTNDSSYYLTESGRLMPTSHNFTSRVTVVLGSKINQILRSDSLGNPAKRKEFVAFMNYIYKDDFLRAQVQTIEIFDDEKLVLYPQVTHQLIEFGKCGNYVNKFEKLKIFYEQILPRKGWLSYSKVKLQYKDQIICE